MIKPLYIILLTCLISMPLAHADELRRVRDVRVEQPFTVGLLHAIPLLGDRLVPAPRIALNDPFAVSTRVYSLQKRDSQSAYELGHLVGQFIVILLSGGVMLTLSEAAKRRWGS